MPTPTLLDAKLFFQSDILINNKVSDQRLQYWIDDIVDKGLVSERNFGKLFKNAFLNMLGHFLYSFEIRNAVSSTGAPITSDSTSQVSRSFDTSGARNNFERQLFTTKYGRMYLMLLEQLAVTKVGLVTGCYS